MRAYAWIPVWVAVVALNSRGLSLMNQTTSYLTLRTFVFSLCSCKLHLWMYRSIKASRQRDLQQSKVFGQVVQTGLVSRRKCVSISLRQAVLTIVLNVKRA